MAGDRRAGTARSSCAGRSAVRELIRTLAAKLPPRAYETASFERAMGYPWERPPGSYRLTGAGVDLLADMGAGERERVLSQFTFYAGGRSPVLAIGSNAAPETLKGKFAHFPEEDDRAVLALTGRLHDFDVGAAAQPTAYGSMPATLFPSPKTAVCATVLWVTPTQFTQLAWSEFSYHLGKLGTRFEDMSAIAPKIAATVNRASLPFASERWTPYRPDPVASNR